MDTYTWGLNNDSGIWYVYIYTTKDNKCIAKIPYKQIINKYDIINKTK